MKSAHSGHFWSKSKTYDNNWFLIFKWPPLYVTLKLDNTFYFNHILFSNRPVLTNQAYRSRTRHISKTIRSKSPHPRFWFRFCRRRGRLSRLRDDCRTPGSWFKRSLGSLEFWGLWPSFVKFRTLFAEAVELERTDPSINNNYLVNLTAVNF
jgi:hypothetical protein